MANVADPQGVDSRAMMKRNEYVFLGTPHRAVKLPPDMTRVDSIQWDCLNGHDYDGVYLHPPLTLLDTLPVQVPGSTRPT